MNRWLYLWRKLMRQLWVRASAYAIFGVAAALLAVVGAPWVPKDLAERLGGGGSVEAILTILASSLLAVATFSVGAMVTAYTAVSSAATPRVSQLITADPQTQKSLATFVGAFLYAVVAVTAVNAQYYAAEGRTILFLFSLVMVGLVAFRLLAWINRLGHLARVTHMIELVEDRTRDAMILRRKNPYLGGRPGVLRQDATPIPSPTTGYVGNIDADRLQGLAEAGDFRIEIRATPGTFVRRGDALAAVEGTSDQERVIAGISSAFAIGRERSFDQDPRFGLVVLGEIAAKALSPAINDPGTAIQVVGTAVRLLDDWAAAEPGDPRCDRLFAPGLAPADMMEDVFGPIGRYGAGDVTVSVRLRKGLASLAVPAGEFADAASVIAARELRRSKLEMRLADDYQRVAATAV